MAGKAAIFNGGAGGLQKHATASFEAVCGQYIRARTVGGQTGSYVFANIKDDDNYEVIDGSAVVVST
jgi:hypothetical protein